MRAADVLRELGRPIAYYPFLSRYVGGVNASVLFCQIFYWQDKATSALGVHKTVEELEAETGLTYEEQRAARTKLRASGVLIETAKRIEHRTYFRIDEDALERLLSGGPPARTPKKRGPPKSEKSSSPNGKSPFREMGKDQFAGVEKPTPPDGESHARGMADPHSVNGTETTAEITSETTAAAASARPPVDNSAAAAAELQNGEEPGDEAGDVAPPDAEATLLAWLADLPRCAIDPTDDRVHVLTWVGKGVTQPQLAEAYRRAVKRRESADDTRAIGAKFLARFIDEVLAATSVDVAPPASTSGQWWESDSGISAQGKSKRVERRPNETTPDYLIRVAQASGRGPWIEHVLKRWQGTARYQSVIEFFGDQLLPVDFYAS
ncbi:hypothetical protein [Paraburkholderia sp. Ac-20347]|uniref:hypothetical protein n=1 Tax=Paraburkholderia sp. Ac-20347 TaxID=2703892 RepID=UPI00197D6DF2|nr:hypothetical protein [Paraburkholderia sp. Ac-20347]MBN3811690.1 hypothetical protein [Paraburkholderia sp. Ac-20347]